jgi:hypothetical protein
VCESYSLEKRHLLLGDSSIGQIQDFIGLSETRSFPHFPVCKTDPSSNRFEPWVVIWLIYVDAQWTTWTEMRASAIAVQERLASIVHYGNFVQRLLWLLFDRSAGMSGEWRNKRNGRVCTSTFRILVSGSSIGLSFVGNSYPCYAKGRLQCLKYRTGIT